MDEVNKLLAANFIREVYYPEWLANIVMVKKANGKWRMCVNFTDLNSACCHAPNPIPGFVTMTGMLISSLNLILTRTNLTL